MSKKNIPEEEYFAFLLELRDSGVTNMYGACPYLEREFGVSTKEASEMLSKWMDSFSN